MMSSPTVIAAMTTLAAITPFLLYEGRTWMQFINLFAFDGSQIVCFLTGCAIITMPIAGGALVCVRHYKFYIMEAFSMFQIFPF
jgi:uncharacterized membrane protein